ncbi:MAG: 50S ribosomal protein L9, partial [Dehalococcoidia bacterium]
MKVVFLEDVPNVAETGEVKEVADGYGRNFLIPKKLAILADAKATQIIEAQLKKKAQRQAETEAEMRELAKQLEGQEIVLKARAGAKDRLYGSITNADIAEELEKSAGLVVDKRKIELDEPIREVGSYEIAIRLTKDIIPKIKLKVMEEEKEEGKEK